jgi:fatty acid CoA ligase FadD9
VWQCFFSGGRTFLIDDEAYPAGSSKLERLIRECQYASPVLISSTPRLWNAMYSMFQASLAELQKTMTPEAARKEALSQYREMLGERLQMATIGGGASSPEVQQWMFDCFRCIVNNGFGTTEAGGVASGGPGSELRFTEDCEWRLRSVPELGYDANGDPPTGELLVKTPTMASGYFKVFFVFFFLPLITFFFLQSPDQTRSAFTKDGYFATGDIVQVINGKCQIIDRAKNFVKLAQGEFVATEHLESVFGGIPCVAQICVHADSLQSFLLAVVVPNYDLLRRGASGGSGRSEEELRATCGPQILAEIAKCAVSHKLAGYECPRGLLLSPVEFTAENGMLTSSLKPNRRGIAAHFEQELKLKYAELAQVQLVDVLRMILPSAGGASEADLSSKTFAELGGDSLRAQKLQAVVSSQLGVDVPINMLLGGQSSMQKVADYIELRRQQQSLTGVDQDGEPPLAESIDVAQLVALPEASYAHAPDDVMINTYFLTGATGFLGLHILHALLQLGAARVDCLVRAKTVAHGKQRLQEAAGRSGMVLDCERVFVVLGDIAEPRLGMESTEWERILKRTDCIVHCAALVNSRLSALQLLPSNALSTRECIGLCGSGGRPKRFVYVSSSGVLYPFVARGDTGIEGPLKWDESLMRMTGGYTATKLLGELCCYEAQRRGLSVRIVRPSSISPHQESGDYNAEDTFCRIIQACLIQRSVPIPASVEEHTINLVPVDWCAAYVAVAASTTEAFPAVSNCVANQSTKWSTILRWLSELEQCKPVAYDEWLSQLQGIVESSESIVASTTLNRPHPLLALMPRFQRQFPYFGDFYTDNRIHNNLCRAAMQSAAPVITKQVFATFLALLAKNKN